MFDLDETLIHTMSAERKPADKAPTFVFADDPSTVVFFRDHLIDMLVKFYLENRFDIGCFTAGTQDYAEPILVDIERKVFQHPAI